MADDKSKAGGPDRDRINVHEDYELRDRPPKFGITPEKFKEVGPMVTDVEKALK